MKKDIRKLNIAYIGGGSKDWARKIMVDLALDDKICGTVKLYDMNYDAARRNEKIGNRISADSRAKSNWKYTAVERIEESLAGADFVVISILPGTFKEMESDVHTPEKFAIYQSVGDSVGPGGLVRALRTIPIYFEFGEKIKQYCPNAWVINYTNPMSLCTGALYRVFPGIKAFGCCHEIFHVESLLCGALSEIEGIKGVGRNDLDINVIGINHFTWINKASYENIDLIPIYKSFVDKFYESGFDFNEGFDIYFASLNKVKFELFKQFGIIAAAGDRHLAEFLPCSWFLKDKATVDRWGFNLTPVSYRIESDKIKEEKARAIADDNADVEIKPSGEESLKIIKALVGLEHLVTNVNFPNRGQIANLPENAIVETNALFSFDSIRPLYAGSIPPEINSIVSHHVFNQETVLQAAVKKDLNLAFNAFSNDPLVSSLDLSDARKLFDEMILNTKKYLGYFGI